MSLLSGWDDLISCNNISKESDVDRPVNKHRHCPWSSCTVQALLADLRLDVPASTVPTLLIVLGIRTFFLGIIRFADCLRFAMAPHDSHASFGITKVTNLVRKVWI